MAKDEARNVILATWQKEWDSCGVGRWSHRLILDIKKMVLTEIWGDQFPRHPILTGHGCYASYLRRFAIQASDECPLCGASPDTPEHAIFECDAWENLRRDSRALLGVQNLNPDIIVEQMLSSPHSWSTIRRFISHIMVEREAEERARQGQ